jgi:hypothetical protein
MQPAPQLTAAVSAVRSTTEALRRSDLDAGERRRLECEVTHHIQAVAAALEAMGSTAS